MKYAVAFFILGTSVGFAQFDSGNNRVNIPPAEIKTTPISEKPATKPFELPPSIKDPNTSPPSSILKKENEISLTRKNEFVNPGKRVEEKLNKRGDGEMYKAIRKNVHLGYFYTKSKYLVIKYRDHGLIDSDQIQLLNNDKVLASNEVLEGSFKSVQFDLSMGFNKVDVLALNQGMVGDNTAEYEIYDDQGKKITDEILSLATSFRATIVVVKE
jgi:hypothetical protein